MGIYSSYVLPQLTKWAMSSKIFREERAACVARAQGSVLEIGFGNGLNLRHYSDKVKKLTGIDPSTQSERLARKDIAACAFPVELHTGSAEALPYDAASFDSVTITWTLCTIPDPAAALGEVARVLRPGGRFYYVEHGLSPDPGVARWQHRLNPIQNFIAGGCNLTRDIAGLVTAAGFVLEEAETGYVKGPKPLTYLYRGVARVADAPRA